MSSRGASAETSHLNGSGSENWESLAETEDDEVEPERDASDAYYAKVRAAGTGMTMGRSPAGNMGLGIGLGTAKGFGARAGAGVAYGARAQQQQQGMQVQRREMSYDDETF